jgi:hypothetical protein
MDGCGDNTEHSIHSDLVGAYLLTCVECGSVSSLQAFGWRAYRTDEPHTDELPALAFYCPQCSSEHFG